MATFKDKTGQEWSIELDSPLLKRINETFGILLTDIRNDAMAQLACDPILLVDVVYFICQKQADARQLTSIEFGERIDGTALDAAAAALEDAIKNFFPSGKRSYLQSLREKNRIATEETIVTAAEQIGSPEMIKTAATLLAQKFQEEVRRGLERLDVTVTSPTAENSVAPSSTATTQ